MSDDQRTELSTLPAADEPDSAGASSSAPTFIGPRGAPRWRVESVFVRVVATSGIIGICVALAAILGTQSVAPWIIGLATSAVSVLFAAVLWSSRTL